MAGSTSDDGTESSTYAGTDIAETKGSGPILSMKEGLKAKVGILSSKADSDVTCVVGYFMVMVTTAINGDDSLETLAAVLGDIVTGALSSKPKVQAPLFGRALLGRPPVASIPKARSPKENVVPGSPPLRSGEWSTTRQIKRGFGFGTIKDREERHHGNEKIRHAPSKMNGYPVGSWFGGGFCSYAFV